MKTISSKIDESTGYYNRIQRRLKIKKRLRKESELVKGESMSVLEEFEEIDYTGLKV